MPQRTKLTEEEELQKLKEVAERLRDIPILMPEKRAAAEEYMKKVALKAKEKEKSNYVLNLIGMESMPNKDQKLQELKSLADKFKDTPIILKEKHERAKAFWAEYERLEKEGTLYKK